MAALQLVQQQRSTQDERLDVLGKEAQEFEGKELMARYEKAKRFMWAKEEFGLEHGGDRQTAESNVNKITLKYTSFDDWCDQFGFNRSGALQDIKVAELLGDRADLSQIKTAWTSFVPVAYAKDKEKKAEVLDRIFSGEKLKGSEVKEALADLIANADEDTHDEIYGNVAVVQKQLHQLATERLSGQTAEELEEFFEEARAEQAKAKETSKVAKQQYRQQFADGVEAGRRVTAEFQDWQVAVKVLLDQHGITLPPLSEETVEHFVLENLFGKKQYVS